MAVTMYPRGVTDMFDEMATALSTAIGSWDRVQKRRRMRVLLLLAATTLMVAWFALT